MSDENINFPNAVNAPAHGEIERLSDGTFKCKFRVILNGVEYGCDILGPSIEKVEECMEQTYYGLRYL